jgi:hypothetical protein
VNLVREHIETYEQLQTLVMIGRRPDREWTETAIEAALMLPAGKGSELLDHLVTSGLLVRLQGRVGDIFRCHPDLVLALRQLTNPIVEVDDSDGHPVTNGRSIS